MGNIPPSVLRQPPQPLPPHHNRLLLPEDKEERITEMVERNYSHNYYLRSCKRKRLMNIESLPSDLLFEVLARLPAQDIYDTARSVCRKWYRMIRTHNFVYAHLQHATYGLLFHFEHEDSVFITMEQGRIEISKFRRVRCPVSASCNGLILQLKPIADSRSIYIVNPVTKQIFNLPPVIRAITHSCSCGIAYAASSMEYKVVASYLYEGMSTSQSYPYGGKSTLQPCIILTVGVDESWRNVRTEHLSLTAMKAFLVFPLITEGFVHWAMCCNAVLTLNVETEIVTETPVPITIPQSRGSHMVFLSAGRYLSLLITRGDLLWEVWEMKPVTGEWRKLLDISLEAFGGFVFKHNEYPLPIGWLKYLEVLVFHVSCGHLRVVYFYDLLTKEIDTIKLPTLREFCKPLVHKSSLVWSAGW